MFLITETIFMFNSVRGLTDFVTSSGPAGGPAGGPKRPLFKLTF